MRGCMQHDVERFELHHTVLDFGGQGRHVTTPDEVVRVIASITAEGHTEQRMVEVHWKSIEYIEGLQVTCLSEAIRQSARIRVCFACLFTTRQQVARGLVQPVGCGLSGAPCALRPRCVLGVVEACAWVW